MPPAPRPSFEWHLRTRTLSLGPRTLLMAILNVTPDSFSDGGRYLDLPQAVAHALTLVDAGADILDIGGESTRPHATPVSPAEEQSRILPVLEAIRRDCPDAILSIDTYHASTARLAIEAGAEIVNDISGHTWDPAMSSTCATLRCGTILMHTRGTPQTWSTLPPLPREEVLPSVLAGLTQNIAAAIAAGITRNRLVLDPGFGFGKIGPANFTLLAHLDQLQSLELPILAGISRKRFLKLPSTQTDQPDPQLEAATTAANTAAILAGAHILRVHNIADARIAAHIADATIASR